MMKIIQIILTIVRFFLTIIKIVGLFLIKRIINVIVYLFLTLIMLFIIYLVINNYILA